MTFKAKIRTILENNPAGLLWCGGYIYFGRKVLYALVYYQRVMTILENKKGKDLRHSKAQGEASARTLGISLLNSHNDSLRVDGVSLETDGIVVAMTFPETSLH